jgi:hypothetical protein
MAFDLAGYKTVPERIAEFREKHPDGSLQPADPSRPFWIEEVGGRTFVCYSAAAYRSPEDPRPGIGTAWEPFPGPTPYTKDSEVQNAETSAWGRAIVAVLASESSAVASQEDVRNREDARQSSAPRADGIATERQIVLLKKKLDGKGFADVLPDGWSEAGLPEDFGAFPANQVNDALAFVEKINQ